MKINGWIARFYTCFIALLIVAGLCFTTQTLADEPTSSALEQLEQAIEGVKESRVKNDAHAAVWAELTHFQNNLWRAMALDPAPGAYVPVAQVPKNLFAAELNSELAESLEALKKSSLPKDARAQFEFDQYTQLVQTIIDSRATRKFPQARAIAKRGTLDSVYEMLTKKISQNADGIEGTQNHEITPAQVTQISNLVKNLKEDHQSQTKDTAKKDLFANGNQFIWYTIAALFGFFLGIAGYRMNPDFFQKFLDQQTSTAPTATTHTASGALKLDYARWLKEFEEILTRLKSSQLSHERRIEDVVQNSGKISQHALALYADARIKNEANLEFRMSTLLREIQHTFEQSQKLQAGDRAQINLMLEHCLRLCDGIENNAILYDRQKLAEPPHMRVS